MVSTEFNDRPVLVNGEVTQFLGFDIVTSERLSVAASVRNIIVFVKSGLMLGMWRDMENYIDQRIRSLRTCALAAPPPPSPVTCACSPARSFPSSARIRAAPDITP